MRELLVGETLVKKYHRHWVLLFRHLVLASIMLVFVLVFIALMDGTVSAHDDTTLDELWKINVGSGFAAPPMTFEVNGKQYVAVLSGLSPITRRRHQFTPELREQRNQTMLFVFAM